jgi:hypothetical protein
MDNKRVDNWVNRYGKAGKDGLVLMVDIVGDMASHRNTDGAGRLAGKVPDDVLACFGRIIRARFGTGADDKPLVTGKKDATHANKFTFKLKFIGENPALTNETTTSWNIVQEAVKRGASFNDAALHKALRDLWKKPEEEDKEFDYDGVAKRLLSRVIDGNGNLPAMIAALTRLQKAKKATEAPASASPEADKGDAIVIAA